MPKLSTASLERRYFNNHPVQGPRLDSDDKQTRIVAWIAAEHARGRNIGGVNIDFNGNCYEWMSWERMMSE